MFKMAVKSVIVTGGASGIGLAMSRHFASEGHNIAILDVNVEAGENVAKELQTEFPGTKVSFKRCDVSSWDEQARVFEEVYREHGGVIDVVMANAGIAEGGAVTVVDLKEDTPSKPRLKTLDINLVGTIYCECFVCFGIVGLLTGVAVKLAVHYMNKKKESGASRGSIICTASNAGLYPLPMAPLYAATKFGVVGLVRSLERVIAKANIQINALAPAVLGVSCLPAI